MSWYQIKLFLQHSAGITMDATHVIVGVLILLLAARLTRRSVADPLPWLCVFVLELINEASDLWGEQWPEPGMQYGESAKDILLTMFLPTILLLAARLSPGIFGPRGRPAAAPREPDEQTP
jgi:hypothetical protein